MVEKDTKSRLTELREILQLSQKDFATSIGVSQGALSQLESGKSKLSLDTIQKISEAFKADCNWLVNGKGGIFLDNTIRKHSFVTIDFDKKTTIPLISEEAHAGYIKNHTNSDYIKTLAAYKIPGYENGNFRLFEIEGDSMLPTIHPREIVVTEFTEEWGKLGNGKICVVITEEGIVAKRVYFVDDDLNNIILKSDNSEYKTYNIDIKEVKEIWEVKAKITSIFTDTPDNHSEKIKTLESDIDLLKKQMKKLNKAPK